MELRLSDAWGTRGRATKVCPHCASDDVRPSRRQYRGLWAALFGARPMKCDVCYRYFAVSGRGHGTRADVEISDVPLPFRSTEGAAEPLKPASRQTPVPAREVSRVKGGCPRCGSDAVRPAVPGPLESIVTRLGVKDLYRCLSCNASFKRLNFLKLALLSGLLLVVLSMLTYAGVSGLGRVSRSNTSPKIRNKPLPTVTPPAFR